MLLNLFLYCDLPEKGQFGFQDPATPVVEGMHSFHNYLTFFGILVVAVFVFFMLFVTIVYFREENCLNFFACFKKVHDSYINSLEQSKTLSIRMSKEPFAVVLKNTTITINIMLIIYFLVNGIFILFFSINSPNIFLSIFNRPYFVCSLFSLIFCLDTFFSIFFIYEDGLYNQNRYMFYFVMYGKLFGKLFLKSLPILITSGSIVGTTYDNHIYSTIMVKDETGVEHRPTLTSIGLKKVRGEITWYGLVVRFLDPIVSAQEDASRSNLFHLKEEAAAREFRLAKDKELQEKFLAEQEAKRPKKPNSYGLPWLIFGSRRTTRDNSTTRSTNSNLDEVD